MHTKTIDILYKAIDGGLRKSGVSNVEQVTKNCMEAIVDAMAGCQWYIPQHQVGKSIEQRIFDEFDGNNVKYLALKYGYSTAWIYQIIKEQRSKSKLSDA